MTPSELATSISLPPRAIIIEGTLADRTKKQKDADGNEIGSISGLTPHHIIYGIPTVPFEGDEPMPVHQDGAAIECSIAEKPFLPAISNAYGKSLNMVHLTFGSTTAAPTTNELKLLREAGQIFKENLGRPVLLTVVPVIAQGQGGVALGRFYPLAMFTTDGVPLFLHPLAKEHKLIKCEFPVNQKIRTTSMQVAAPAPIQAPIPALPAWYSAMADTVATFTKLKGAKLHEAVLNTRAGHVAKEQKIALKAALAAVTAEYDTCVTAAKAQAATAATKVVPVVTQPTAPARKSFLSARV